MRTKCVIFVVIWYVTFDVVIVQVLDQIGHVTVQLFPATGPNVFGIALSNMILLCQQKSEY